jgi:hypothetical protein
MDKVAGLDMRREDRFHITSGILNAGFGLERTNNSYPFPGAGPPGNLGNRMHPYPAERFNNGPTRILHCQRYRTRGIFVQVPVDDPLRQKSQMLRRAEITPGFTCPLRNWCLATARYLN